ncbi:sulfotransferase family protein [Xenococcus sp. PCC 7305]|uniref:sulfotransferase domain-containing protein n=1 Tax=Xenococcus sp. PCC 7305 TaxID=102125 RepID=UPI0002AC7FB2|nr:sulfotransferase domain-containing protein [Xenococcus sp. PCC 7305]ELS04911.1 sulfotransferase family protein [Xenococcus sp. PCC 7305]
MIVKKNISKDQLSTKENIFEIIKDFQCQTEFETIIDVYYESATSNNQDVQAWQVLVYLYEYQANFLEENIKIYQGIILDFASRLSQIDVSAYVAEKEQKKSHFFKRIVIYQEESNDKDNLKYLQNLAALYKDFNNILLANIEDYNTLLRSSADRTLYFKIGKIFSQKGRPDIAQNIYESAIQAIPEFSQFYFDLGRILLQRNEVNKAVDYFLQGNQLTPLGGKTLLNSFNLSYPDLPWETLEKARLAFQERADNLGKTSHQNFLVNFGLAEILTNQRKIPEAIKFYKLASHQKCLVEKPLYAQYINQHGSPRNYQNPDFILIGFNKCGSTSMYNYMIQHDRILPALEKEIHYFNSLPEIFGEQPEDLNWYRSHFASTPDNGQFITGEATVMYVIYPGIEKMILEQFPNLKLIVILRNPIDRAVSHYHMIKRCKGETRSLEEVFNLQLAEFGEGHDALELAREIFNNNLTQPKNRYQRKRYSKIGRTSYLGASLYMAHLKRWLDIFPQERFLFLKNEDLDQNPDEVMKKTFEFLGLPNQKIDDYRRYKLASYPGISNDLYQRLCRFFQPHNQWLEDSLKMKFNW